MDKFLNKKKKRTTNNKESKFSHINIMENLFTKAKILYEDKVILFNIVLYLCFRKFT